MNTFSRAELQTLAGVSAHWCVSIFMPTHRGAPKPQQQDPVQLENLLKQAGGKLSALGMRTPDARQLLEPGDALLNQPLFWQHPADGLALFLAPGRSNVYQVPLPLRDFVAVADHFHLKPLLPLL